MTGYKDKKERNVSVIYIWKNVWLLLIWRSSGLFLGKCEGLREWGKQKNERFDRKLSRIKIIHGEVVEEHANLSCCTALRSARTFKDIEVHRVHKTTFINKNWVVWTCINLTLSWYGLRCLFCRFYSPETKNKLLSVVLSRLLDALDFPGLTSTRNQRREINLDDFTVQSEVQHFETPLEIM